MKQLFFGLIQKGAFLQTKGASDPCADLNRAGLCWVSCRKFSDAVMTIFSSQSVIVEFTHHILVMVRIAWNPGRGGTKKVPGNRYSTQWKTPQK